MRRLIRFQKKGVGLVLLLLSCLTTNAQSAIDSLLDERRNASHDSVRIDTDLRIGEILSKKDIDSARFYFDRAYELALRVSDTYPDWEPKVLIAKGDALSNSDLDDEAMATLKQAVTMARNKGLNALECKAQFRLGYAYMNARDYLTAILHYDSVSARNEREGTGYSLADCYNFSGLCNFYLRKLDIASEKALKAIRYRRAVGDTTYIHNPYMVHALVLWEQKEYEESKMYFRKVVHNAGAIQDLRRVRIAHTNLAFVLLEQDSADAAIEQMTAAWEISKQTGNQWGSVRYYNMVGEVEIDRGNYQLGHDYIKKSMDYIHPNTAPQSKGDIYLDLAHAKIVLADSVYGSNVQKRTQLFTEALPLAEQGWVLASQVHSANVMLDAAEVLARLYSEFNRYEEAFEFSQKAKAISEDINDKARTEAIAQMTTEYETERIATENTLLQATKKSQEAQIKQQHYLIYGAVAVLVLIVLIALIIYRSSLRLKKANETIQQSLSEKELLLKEIHHRVKNNLQVVSSLLDLQSRNIEDEEALNTFMEGQNRVKAMALIHQKLYQNENLATIDFEDYAKNLMSELAAIYPAAKAVQYNIKANCDTQFDIDTAIPLGLILNELISNAYKYAFAGADAGVLSITIDTQGEGKHSLVVSDSGSGLPEGFNLARPKSLGLRLVGRLAKQLYGSLEYYRDEGTHFRIHFLETQLRKSL